MTYIDDLAEQVHDRIDPDLLPDGDTTLLFQLYALLVLAKGTEVGASDVHNAWVVWMLQVNADHASLRTFDTLEAHVQAADLPFVEAIRQVAQLRFAGGLRGRLPTAPDGS